MERIVLVPGAGRDTRPMTITQPARPDSAAISALRIRASSSTASRPAASRTAVSIPVASFPEPGAMGYQDKWQLTVNIPGDELHESADLARRHRANRTT